MNKQIFSKIKGFTLIEILVVLAFVSILSVVLARFIGEGVNKGYFNSSESSAIRDCRVLFRYIDLDVRHAYKLPASFKDLNTDSQTLIVNTVSDEERFRLLSQEGNLAGEKPARGKAVTVVYKMDSSGNIVRDVYNNNSKLISSMVIIGHIESLTFSLDSAAPDSASWVEVSLTRKSNIKDLWQTRDINRVFRIGGI